MRRTSWQIIIFSRMGPPQPILLNFPPTATLQAKVTTNNRTSTEVSIHTDVRSDRAPVLKTLPPMVTGVQIRRRPRNLLTFGRNLRVHLPQSTLAPLLQAAPDLALTAIKVQVVNLALLVKRRVLSMVMVGWGVQIRPPALLSLHSGLTSEPHPLLRTVPPMLDHPPQSLPPPPAPLHLLRRCDDHHHYHKELSLLLRNGCPEMTAILVQWLTTQIQEYVAVV